MNPATVLDFVNLFFAGMLAGIEFVIHYGLRGPSELLDDHAQLQLRQALVLRLRVLVPAFFVPTAVLGIALTILNGGTPGFWFRCAGVVALLTWIAIRVIGTVPINSATLATQGLEGASQSRGAVPYCWGLGGGPGICVLLDGRGTPAGRSLTCEKTRGGIIGKPARDSASAFSRCGFVFFKKACSYR